MAYPTPPPTVRRTAVVWFVALLLVVAGAVPAAATAPGRPAEETRTATTPDPGGGPGPTDATLGVAATRNASGAAAGSSSGPLKAVVTADLSPRTPGKVELTVTYSNIDPGTELKIALPCAREQHLDCDNPSAWANLSSAPTLVSHQGFARSSATKWELESGSNRTATVTYTIDPNVTQSHTGRRISIDAGEWAWVSLNSVAPTTNYDHDEVETVAKSAEGIDTEHVLLLGNVTVRHRTFNGQRVKMISVPKTPLSDAEADELFALLEKVSYDLRTGTRDPELNVFLNWFTSSASGRTIRLNPTGFTTNGTLAHEYIHTRQRYGGGGFESCDGSDTGCASWLLESQAMYWESLVTTYYGRNTIIIGARVATYPPSVADERKYPLTDIDHPTHSSRGARTLLALDWRIRNETNGQKSIQDVFRRLNEYERTRGTVTHSVFTQVVANVVGRPLTSFMTTYVEGTATPGPGMVPPRSTMADPSWIRDGDGHWNTSVSLSTNRSVIPPSDDQVNVTVENNGSDPGIGYVTTVRTRGAYRIGSATAHKGRWNGTTNTWNVTDLDAGESATLTVTLDPPRFRTDPPNVTARVTDADGNSDTADAVGINISNVSVPGPSVGDAKLIDMTPSDTGLRAGETLGVVATVENPGSLDGRYELGLLVNGSVVARQRAVVPGGGRTTVSFSHRFASPGEKDVTVAALNNSRIGDVLPPETIDVAEARPSVAVAPDRHTTAPGGSETYDLTVADVPRGVGGYAVDLQVNNSTVANVTDVTVVGGSGTTRIAGSGATATVDASGLTTQNGTVTVARVTLAGQQVGWANLSVRVRRLTDERGANYTVGATDDGLLRVEPPGRTSLDAILSPDRIEGLECTEGVCDALRAAGLTDDERALVHVRTDDGTRYYFARVENGRVTEFRSVSDQSAVDRTVNVRTSADTIRDVWTADDRARAAERAVRTDRITVDGAGTGPVNRVRISAANAVKDVYELATDVASAVDDTIDGLFGTVAPVAATPHG